MNIPYQDELPKPDLSKPTRLARDVKKHDAQADRSKAKREAKKAEHAAWTKRRQEAFIRDGGICRATGRPLELYDTNPLKMAHIHHIVFKSAGGTDELSNLITLWPPIHDEIHAHKLDCRGNGDGTVEFKRRNLETGEVLRTWESRPRGKA